MSGGCVDLHNRSHSTASDLYKISSDWHTTSPTFPPPRTVHNSLMSDGPTVESRRLYKNLPSPTTKSCTPGTFHIGLVDP